MSLLYAALIFGAGYFSGAMRLLDRFIPKSAVARALDKKRKEADDRLEAELMAAMDKKPAQAQSQTTPSV